MNFDRFVLIIVLLLFGKAIVAQQILFRNYSVEDGLKSNTVWSILQDRQGYMWFGTKNGLSRFDGYQFKTYQSDKDNPNSIGNNFVLDICEVDAKTFWIGTEKGVYIFNLETEKFSFFSPIREDAIYNIYKDKKGILWIATHNSGLYRYDPSTKMIRNFRKTRDFSRYSLSSNRIQRIAEDQDGYIWLAAYGGGVDRLDPSTFSVIRYSAENSNLSSNQTIALYVDLKGDLWIGTMQEGLNRWQKETGTIKNYKKSESGSIKDNIVRSIFQSSPDKLYVGTERGLSVLDLSTDRFYNYEKQTSDIFSISDNAIYAISPDREGNIWVGTFFGGVNYFRDKGYTFEMYYPKVQPNSLTGSAVSCFLEDEPGKFWVGTEDGGLNYFDSFTGEFKRYPFLTQQQALSYHNIHALFKDRSGNIWIGTFTGGLNVYNPKNGKIKRYKNNPDDPTSLSGDIVYSIYEDRDGTIWVGAVTGLNKYNPETDSFVRINDMGLASRRIYDIYEDEDYNLWVATYDSGLIVYNKQSGKWDEFIQYDGGNSLSSNKLTCLLDDRKGNLWIGTEGGGLNRLNLKERTIKVYGSAEGIEANVVYGILQDDRSNLWISTNNSLYRLDPKTGKAKHYAGWNQVQSKQFNYKAYYKASDGKLYFGGVKGFSAFYPDSVGDINAKTKVTLTNFQLFNKDVAIGPTDSPLAKPINFTDEVTLTHRQSVISFEYAALSYVDPKEIQYAYMMEGFDEDWNYVKDQRKATYTNLPAGKYLFKVKATNDNDNWDVAETSIQIVIKPPFYRTNLAYMIYLLLIAGSVVGMRSYIIRQGRRRNLIRLERLKNKREQEFYAQKIEFFTAMAHEVRTPLSLIIAPLEKLLNSNKWNRDEQEQLQIMDENSNRLLDLVNQLLDFRRIESDIYKIHFEEVEIVSLVQSIYSRFSSIPYQKGLKFVLSTTVNQLWVQVDPEALTKILNNLIINAFKFTREKVKISIDEPAKDAHGQSWFSISVEDDGIGIPESEQDNIFKKFFKVSSGNNQYNNLGSTGIGLALAKSLTEKHGGRLEVSSKEEVNTIFKVVLPYIENHANIQLQRPAEPDEESTEKESDRTTILITEDDPSLLDFIAKNLHIEGYKAICAHNGIEALDLLEKETVDLIISDVMMPEMDGLTLCKTVKSNIEYSHIPVILLTARGNSDTEIEGVKYGADSYIIKPFKWKYVIAVVKNLLESRSVLKEKFAGQPFTKAGNLTTNTHDKKFIETIVSTVEERLADPQLSVEELSRDMGMSRSSLHKKLKSLTGYVPNEFIRIVRLKHAARLLLTNDYSISQIGHIVGFNSHSYFSKCFFQQFKLTPKEFIDKYTDTEKIDINL